MKTTYEQALHNLSHILQKYLSGERLAEYDAKKQAALTGNDDQKFDFNDCAQKAIVGKMHVFPVTVDTPEERKALLENLLILDEALAERGHVKAMRYAACDYSNGFNRREIHKTADGWSMSSAPDFAKAVEWARKAEAAGDPVAAKIRPGLERDLADSKAPKR